MIRVYIAIGLFSTILTACGGGGGSGGGSATQTTTTTVAAEQIPLLQPAQAGGVIYSTADPSAKPTLDVAFNECLMAGANAYELAVTWASLESSTTPGTIDLSQLETLLNTLQSSGVQVYLALQTIDTVALQLPPDLMDSTDSTKLAPGLSFDSPVVLNRFRALLDQLIPLLVSKGGFCLSVGNEVDIFLANQTQYQAGFINFVGVARDHAHQINSQLAIGATVTHKVLTQNQALFQGIKSNSDVCLWTYYPLNSNHEVESPTVAATDIQALVQASAPKQLMFQEVGYPAGYATPGNQSSELKQDQFYVNVFQEAKMHPEIRFVSALHLADYTSSDVDGFVQYYGGTDPRFREFLATLGVRNTDGSTKMAYSSLISGLQLLQQP